MRALILLLASVAFASEYTQPSVVSKTEPKYTADARKRRVEGKVILRIVVGVNGKARDVRVVSHLDPGLDAAAVSAVKRWRFRPAVRDKQPVASQAEVSVAFKLQKQP